MTLISDVVFNGIIGNPDPAADPKPDPILANPNFMVIVLFECTGNFIGIISVTTGVESIEYSKAFSRIETESLTLTITSTKAGGWGPLIQVIHE